MGQPKTTDIVYMFFRRMEFSLYFMERQVPYMALWQLFVLITLVAVRLVGLRRGQQRIGFVCSASPNMRTSDRL